MPAAFPRGIGRAAHAASVADACRLGINDDDPAISAGVGDGPQLARGVARGEIGHEVVERHAL